MLFRKSSDEKIQKFKKRLKKRRAKKIIKVRPAKSSVVKSKVLKTLSIGGLCVFFLVIFALSWCFSTLAQYSSNLPDPDEPFEKKLDLTSYMYDRNGKVLYKMHGDENREIAKIEEIPLHVQWAFLAAEDVDFYAHRGIDLGGIYRAGMYELFKVGEMRGGSTITQQMLKNTVLTRERSYERKIKEMILSMRIEEEYLKEDILQLYINEIGFGGNTYGIKAASKVYFGKSVKNLTLAEAAFLAGLPQSPGRYSPLFASDIKAARKLSMSRQKYVLDQFEKKSKKINEYVRKYNDWDRDDDFITTKRIKRARKQKIKLKNGKTNIKAPHFVFYVQQELLKGKYNNGKQFTLNEIERGGLKITTSLDYSLQKQAKKSVKWGLENYAKPYGGNNVSLVSIDPQTGQILAMIGSANYFGKKYPEGCKLGKNCKFEPQVNVAVSLRQPGSSIKPMMYYTGFESGKLYPSYTFVDAPIKFRGTYEPRNNSGTFRNGPISLRQALKESLNIPAVEGVEIVGVKNFIRKLRKFGYTTFDNPERFGPAIALGAGEVKLVEHVNAFSILANQGTQHPISPILKVEDSEGNVLYDHKKDDSGKERKVADERACFMINDILKYYWYNPPIPGYEFAGKTGTSDSNKNVYYIGYSPEVVTGVWVGNNDNTRMSTSAYGATVANPIWANYNNATLTRFKKASFSKPNGVVRASTCYDSNLLANNGCRAVSDYFIASKLPPVDNNTSVGNVCGWSNVREDKETIRKYTCSSKVYRYIRAPKSEWQKWWNMAFN